MAAHVLVVDDDPASVAAIRDALAGRDLVVDSAEDPASAASLLDERSYCGMVLDIVLRRGSGFDVLNHVARKDLHIPIVVVSSKLPSYVHEVLDAERVKLVFPKPVEPRLLAAIVLAFCGIAS